MSTTASPDPCYVGVVADDPDLAAYVDALVASAPPLPTEAVELVQRVWPRPDEVTPRRSA